MVYLSDVLNLVVQDSRGQRVGTVADVVVNSRESFPVVTAIVVNPAVGPRAARPPQLIIPWRQVVSLEESHIRLTVPANQVQPYTPRNGDQLLARDVLDKQIVDTQGRRVVKVNDLKLAQVKGVARLLGADISFWAFFRRLLPFRFNERVVTWDYVQSLDHPADVRLKVPQTSLSDLHPADLADLLEQMHPEAGIALLHSLDVETAADALEQVEEPFQAPLVEAMDTEKASDLLEAMPPDEAADIIGDLSDDKAEEILASMEAEPAQEVKDLLRYDEHTAGGRMTPEVFTLTSQMTAQQAIDKLRALGPSPDLPYYLFVTTAQGELRGVVPTRGLVTAKPQTEIGSLMQTNVIAVHVNDDQEKVAGILRKYNLLAVPVVDDQQRLLGMVTVDAALDVVHEETKEDISEAVGASPDDVAHTAPPLEAALRRVAWLAAMILGGLLAGLALSQFTSLLQSSITLVYFLPVVIVLGQVVAAQSRTIAALSGPVPSFVQVWHDLRINLLVSAVAGLAVGLIAFVASGTGQLGIVVGLTLAATVVMAALLGGFVPATLKRLGWRMGGSTGPAIDGITSFVAVLLYLVLASYLLHYV